MTIPSNRWCSLNPALILTLTPESRSGPGPSLPVLGGVEATGVLFFREKQLAALRHLFPCRKVPPYPLRLITRKSLVEGLAFSSVLIFQGNSGGAVLFSVSHCFCFLFLFFPIPHWYDVRGWVRFFSAGNGCLSAASCISKGKNLTHPIAAPQTGRLQRDGKLQKRRQSTIAASHPKASRGRL